MFYLNLLRSLNCPHYIFELFYMCCLELAILVCKTRNVFSGGFIGVRYLGQVLANEGEFIMQTFKGQDFDPAFWYKRPCRLTFCLV